MQKHQASLQLCFAKKNAEGKDAEQGAKVGEWPGRFPAKNLCALRVCGFFTNK